MANEPAEALSPTALVRQAANVIALAEKGTIEEPSMTGLRRERRGEEAMGQPTTGIRGTQAADQGLRRTDRGSE